MIITLQGTTKANYIKNKKMSTKGENDPERDQIKIHQFDV